MKRFLSLVVIAFVVLYALSGCGSAGEVIDYSLVFVNHLDATIVEVVVDYNDRTSGARNADSSPLKWGETFGFEVGEYPATLTVYDHIFEEGAGQKELARLTIGEAPRPGERWYVTARDGGYGLVLAADTCWTE